MNKLTQENNQLIAEFEGYETYEMNGYMNGYINVHYSDDNVRTIVDTHYHSSWDWLMPVVSECRDESNGEDSHWEAIYYSLEGCDINVTYKAVVEFIKWHNEQNK
jgi:hypothetical protein